MYGSVVAAASCVALMPPYGKSAVEIYRDQSDCELAALGATSNQQVANAIRPPVYGYGAIGATNAFMSGFQGPMLQARLRDDCLRGRGWIEQAR